MKYFLLLLFSMTALADGPINSSSPLANRQTATAQNITMNVNASMNSLSIAAKSSFNQVYSNPLGLTPQQVMDALGVSACNSTHKFWITANFAVNRNNAGSFTQLVEPYALTCNSDGTVTVGPGPAPSPSPSP